jgi:hypothetical protein
MSVPVTDETDKGLIVDPTVRTDDTEEVATTVEMVTASVPLCPPLPATVPWKVVTDPLLPVDGEVGDELDEPPLPPQADQPVAKIVVMASATNSLGFIWPSALIPPRTMRVASVILEPPLY